MIRRIENEFEVNEFKEFTKEEFAVFFAPVEWSHVRIWCYTTEKFHKAGYPVTIKEYIKHFVKNKKIFAVRLNKDENSKTPIVVFRLRNEKKIYDHLFKRKGKI